MSSRGRGAYDDAPSTAWEHMKFLSHCRKRETFRIQGRLSEFRESNHSPHEHRSSAARITQANLLWYYIKYLELYIAGEKLDI